MTRITKPKRARGGAKRLDLTDLRELLRDRRVWASIGIVTKPAGVDQHWEIVADGPDSVDITVEVVLQPSLEPVTARLKSGMWEVPAEGDEVAVLVPSGRIDFMPIIIARLSGNIVPTVQGPEPGRIVIVPGAGGQVFVHDGAGGASALAKASELQAVSDDLYSHIHEASGSPTSKALAEFTLPDPPGLPLVQPGTPGTTVLLAK